MAGIMIPAVCEQVSCRQEKEEAAQRLTEAQNTLCSRNTALEGGIKHWEFLYGLLDKHTRVLAEKNKHFEVNWPKHENMLNTRIQHRDGVIRGLTESNKTLSRKNADLVGIEQSLQDQIRHRDAAIVRLNKEKEFLFQKLAVTTKKYNVLKVESLNILAEKPDMSLMVLQEEKQCPESKIGTSDKRNEEDQKSLAEKFRKDMAEKKESWASLTKLIKEKLQKIEDKKTHLEEMPTKVLPEKQESLAEEVNLKFEVLKLEEKVTEDSAVKQHSVETVVVTELKQEETSTKDLVDKPNCSEMKVTKMIEGKEMEDNLANEDHSCGTEELEDERKYLEEFPYLPTTGARQVVLQDQESRQEDKLSLAAAVGTVVKERTYEIKSTKDLVRKPNSWEMKVTPMELKVTEVGDNLANKDQSCESKVKKGEHEEKDQEELPHLKKTQAGEARLQKKIRRKEKKQERRRDKENAGRC
ncbi:50S ribosomal protein L15 [Dissostichus eleginoides]|uniref:50S ribosomal protein L15 n=1 Tax=Dissostichus eleginoides TaxID=100907 RepID=A0AAD9CKT9_DISEL|nr:50S ribosomal protein L15 [Dissostichus eleginoides]